jgi:UDP-GlcNAc:undecaprenyl-phosphate GlcNAc-1-phosphate transferase
VELFLAFVVALCVTAALIPVLARWAPAIGLTDAPGPRKVHSVPVPRVGGAAMAAGLIVATALTVKVDQPVTGLLLSLGILLLFGLWDDRVTLGYRTKFAGQVLAVLVCMAVGGVQLGTLTVAGTELLPHWASSLVTFVFLLGVTNAVNLADGLDGLAGGVVLLCLCAIAIFGAISGQTTVSGLALIESGAVLGFLRFNTHPARIFMGDSGSQVLGFSVGVLALLTTQGSSSPLSPALPLLLLGLPIMDTLTVMLTRIRAGRSPFAADRNHLHHRLLALGFAHREAVLIIYVLQVALVLLAYFLRFESDMEVVGAFCLFAAVVLALLRQAAVRGWRMPSNARALQMREHVDDLVSPRRLPGYAAIVMATCLGVYAATVLTFSDPVRSDLGLTCLTILLVMLALTLWKAEHSVKWIERIGAYISVITLVYLDQTMSQKPTFLGPLSWVLIGITCVAALLRFWISSARRFELTTLDLIVIFAALVLPNLPGSVALPTYLPGGIAKAVLFLYVVEMLLSIDVKRLKPRLAIAPLLAFIAVKALFSLHVF